jgi:hypothetical protein
LPARQSSRLRTTLQVAHLASWKFTRVTLTLWGLLNGFGIGLLGQMKQRVSQRVPRVSGSMGLQDR